MQFKFKAMKKKSNTKHALSVDIEDWYHGVIQIKHTEWHKYENRLEKNLDFILRLFRDRNIKATFFILGYIADKFPRLVERIMKDGHEIASHGYYHRPIFEKTKEEFRDDVARSKKAIEAISNVRVKGYRAPIFSVRKDTLWALDILSDLGFEYDSSIFPTKNFMYGIPDAPLRPYRVKGGNIIEFPLSVIRILNTNFPISGGFYLRVLPYIFTKMGLFLYERKGWPAVIYMHPWELDVDKPKIDLALPLKWKIIYEYNIDKMQRKFKSLIKDFEFTTMNEVLAFYRDHI